VTSPQILITARRRATPKLRSKTLGCAKLLALLLTITMLAGCSGTSSSSETSNGGDTPEVASGPPYPDGPWSVGDQADFMGGCEDGTNESYCVCVLGDLQDQYPDSAAAGVDLVTGGITAQEHPDDFPDC